MVVVLGAAAIRRYCSTHMKKHITSHLGISSTDFIAGFTIRGTLLKTGMMVPVYFLKQSGAAELYPGRSFKKNIAVAAVAASLDISLGVPVNDVLAGDHISPCRINRIFHRYSIRLSQTREKLNRFRRI